MGYNLYKLNDIFKLAYQKATIKTVYKKLGEFIRDKNIDDLELLKNFIIKYFYKSSKQKQWLEQNLLDFLKDSAKGIEKKEFGEFAKYLKLNFFKGDE